MRILTKINTLYLVIALLFLGLCFCIYKLSNGPQQTTLVIDDCYQKYRFINTEVACGQKPVISKVGYAETQDDITEYVNEEVRQKNLVDVGVYFRDLENGPVFGINETADFAPASLLKLPLALTYLTLASQDPTLLDKKLSFKQSNVSNQQYFPPTETIQPNTQYTIKELLRRILVYSDNTANGLLEDYLTQTGRVNATMETYIDLGLTIPGSPFDDTLTVRRYGSIFRALYNVSYLNRDLNEELLGWLVESNYKYGLEAGAPEEIKVANKFGERVDAQNNLKQLHDCGIIYYPNNPYLLCVMTKGQDFDKLAGIIAKISQIIYEEVHSRKLE